MRRGEQRETQESDRIFQDLEGRKSTWNRGPVVPSDERLVRSRDRRFPTSSRQTLRLGASINTSFFYLPLIIAIMASAARQAALSAIPPADLQSFTEHLKGSRRILALLGAGISAASGLPTFRGAGGLWRSYDATSLATPEAFDANPGLVWQFYSYRRHMALQAQPNKAHYALAELSRRNKDFITLSQNVDGTATSTSSRFSSCHKLRICLQLTFGLSRSLPAREPPIRAIASPSWLSLQHQMHFLLLQLHTRQRFHRSNCSCPGYPAKGVIPNSLSHRQYGRRSIQVAAERNGTGSCRAAVGIRGLGRYLRCELSYPRIDYG